MELTSDQIRVLRLWCQWELGDRSWANRIRTVIEYPDYVERSLIEEMEDQ
jgi:hypothetical protein